jgi:multidrug efflux pump
VTVEFSLDTNLETAASDVRDQLARAVRYLPPDVNPPISTSPMPTPRPYFGPGVGSAGARSWSSAPLRTHLKERLQTVPGIASVDQPRRSASRCACGLDPEKLTAYNLSPLDVRAATSRENIELPSGRIEGEAIELPVKNPVATQHAGGIQRIDRQAHRRQRGALRDIGYVELGAANERSALKMGDTPIAGLYFKQQPGANQIEIVDALLRALDQIRKEIPDDIRVDVAFDNTEYVRRSLLEVTETSSSLPAPWCWWCLRSCASGATTLIPVIAIPCRSSERSPSFTRAGFSINTLTL